MKNSYGCLASVAILALVPLLALWAVQGIWGLVFNMNCAGYLSRAATATSIELAEENLTQAVAYLEASNMTSGHTWVVIPKPTDDVGYWFKNLKEAQRQLKQDTKNMTELERSNVLMKLRETLETRGNNGSTELVMPSMISSHPYVPIFFWLKCVFGVILFLSLAPFMVK